MCAASQERSVGRLEHILFSGRRDLTKVLVAPLTVYFDDSGTHPTSPIAIAAACIAPYPQWKKFCKEWERAKAEIGFECFHMAECAANNRKSEFADRNLWTDTKKQQAMRRLRAIIKGRAEQGFFMGVSERDYREVVPPEIRAFAGNFAYTFAVSMVIGSLEQWRYGRSKEPTEYIFDWMVKGDSKREINAIFEYAARHSDALQRYGIYKGCNSFRDKCEVLPLQASDIFAWCCFQRAQVAVTGKPMSSLAEETFNWLIAANARGERKFNGGYISRQQLERWVAQKPTQIPTDLP